MRALFILAIATLAVPVTAGAQTTGSTGKAAAQTAAKPGGAGGNSAQSHVVASSRRSTVRGLTPSRPGRKTASGSTTSGPPATGTTIRSSKKAGTSPDLTGH